MSDKELMRVEQLPIITERLHEIKASIEAEAEKITSLAVTEETRAEVKKIKADFKKTFDDLESRRKAVKEEVNRPYAEFEKVYKECVTEPYKKALDILDGKIKFVEAGLIMEKENELWEYFKNTCNLSFLSFEDCGIKIGLSTDVKKAKKEIDAYLEGIHETLDSIALLEPADYAEDVRAAFFRTKDMQAAMREATAYRAAKAEAKEYNLTGKTENASESILDGVNDFLASLEEDEPKKAVDEVIFEDCKVDWMVRFRLLPGQKTKLIELLNKAAVEWKEV